MDTEEHCLKAKAMTPLLQELDGRIRSGEEDGWLTAEDIRAQLSCKEDAFGRVSCSQRMTGD